MRTSSCGGCGDSCCRECTAAPCLCGTSFAAPPARGDSFDALLAPGPLKDLLAELAEEADSLESSSFEVASFFGGDPWEWSAGGFFEEDSLAAGDGESLSAPELEELDDEDEAEGEDEDAGDGEDDEAEAEAEEAPATPQKTPAASPADSREDVPLSAHAGEPPRPAAPLLRRLRDPPAARGAAGPAPACSCGRRVFKVRRFMAAERLGRKKTLPCTACLTWLVDSEKSAPEAAELCGMCLTTFKHRMRARGFSSFPSKGARCINRALKELQDQLGSALSADENDYADLLRGRLAACLEERKRFLEAFSDKLDKGDFDARVVPSQDFMRLRSRMHKCRFKKKGQKLALQRLINEGLSERALRGGTQPGGGAGAPNRAARCSASGVKARS